MVSGTLHVFLIPGFFGFANLGDRKYFEHVRAALGDALAERRGEVLIHDVRTRPTASLRERALRVARAVDEQAPHGDVVLIGHSAGGLDARLLVSPGVNLGDDALVERVASRVKTIVTISTPHHGTPLATAFTDPAGRQLLRLISLITIYLFRDAKLPASVVRQLVESVARLDGGDGETAVSLDRQFRGLLQNFETEQQQALMTFFEDIEEEQALLPQLAPEAVELVNATIREREGIRIASVVSRARPPRFAGMAELGLDAYAQSMYLLYRWLYGQTASGARKSPFRMSEINRDTLEEVYPDVLPPAANDGVVPTGSQVWGEVIHAAWADHLDVLGYFHDPRHVPAHHDWLPSGSRFDRAGFRELWGDVAGFVARG